MRKLSVAFLLISAVFSVRAQKSQLKIAHNAVGKLQACITNKEGAKKQLSIIGEGIKAIEIAEVDRKTKNWPETWAIKSYLSAYVAILDTADESKADKYYEIALKAVEKAKSLDKYQDNSGLIKASVYNINLKKQQIGNRFFEQNDFANALKNLKDVSDFFPKDTTLAVNVALSAQSMQDYTSAISYFKRAKENGIKNAIVYQQLANLYNLKFDKEAAVKTLEEGLDINPHHPLLTNDYINLLLDAEKYEKALKAIESAITVEKKDKMLYYLYGYLQQQKFNNASTAKLAFERALAVDQNYFQAMYQLSLVYIKNANDALKAGDDEQFSQLVNRGEFILLKAHDIDKNDRNTIQLLIEIYTRKNKLDKVQQFKRKLNEF